MAKSLQDLAAEKGYVPAQEVQKDTKKAGRKRKPAAEITRLQEDAAAQLWENMNAEQLKRLQEAAENGDIEQVFLSIMGEIAQDIHENAAAHDVQDVYKPGYDPNLDPRSPEFNIEEYKAAITAAGGFDVIGAQIREHLAEIATRLLDTGEFAQAINGLQEAANTAITGIAAFIQSDTYKAIKESVQAFTAFLEEHRAEIAAFAEMGEEIRDIIPFLQLELEEAKTDPDFADITITELLKQGIDENGNPTESKFRQLIERAKQRRADFEAAEGTIKEVEQAAAKMPLLQAINPAAHTMPNNALMNTLQTQQAINAGAFDMVVSNAKGRRKEITAYTMITFDPGDTSIKITDAKLSEYERQVSDAIISLWIEAIKEDIPPIIYPEMVYRAMPGGGDKASPQQKGAITKAIEKFRHLHIYVDATDEMRKRGVIGSNETMRFDDFYLTARHVEKGKTKNGKKIVENAYYITAEPIILTYCKLTNQLLTVKADYINIRKVDYLKINGEKTKKKKITNELLPMTATRQAMTGYLLRRIAVMKRDEQEAKERKRSYDRRRAKDKSLEEKPLAAFKEQSPVILFDTLFADAGLAGQAKIEAKRNRDFVFQVMDYWIMCGNIKSYEKQTKGRSITGIKILF